MRMKNCRLGLLVIWPASSRLAMTSGRTCWPSRWVVKWHVKTILIFSWLWIRAKVISLLKNAFTDAGLDLYLCPYGCLPTGYECGIIEVRSRSYPGAEMFMFMALRLHPTCFGVCDRWCPRPSRGQPWESCLTAASTRFSRPNSGLPILPPLRLPGATSSSARRGMQLPASCCRCVSLLVSNGLFLWSFLQFPRPFLSGQGQAQWKPPR